MANAHAKTKTGPNEHALSIKKLKPSELENTKSKRNISGCDLTKNDSCACVLIQKKILLLKRQICTVLNIKT